MRSPGQAETALSTKKNREEATCRDHGPMSDIPNWVTIARAMPVTYKQQRWRPNAWEDGGMAGHRTTLGVATIERGKYKNGFGKPFGVHTIAYRRDRVTCPFYFRPDINFVAYLSLVKFTPGEIYHSQPSYQDIARWPNARGNYGFAAHAMYLLHRIQSAKANRSPGEIRFEERLENHKKNTFLTSFKCSHALS